MKFNSLSKSDLLHKLALQIGFSYISWVGRTARWQLEGEEHYILERCKGNPIIFAFWHSQLLLMPFFYLALIRRKSVSVLISQSRDGQIVSDLVERFGLDAIRGSSSRGGFSALLQLNRKLEEGFDLALTPDGPRGPKEHAQSGVVAVASSSGCPILPIACDFKSKKILKSWDGFKIPFPYNYASLVVGPPIQVDKNAEQNHLEAKLREVQKRLNEVNEKARELIITIE